MTISKRLRYEILRRDNHACRYCGRAAPAVALTVDHVLPEALGGSDEASNLVAACVDCNAGKSATTPDAALVDQVADDAIRWARAIAQAAANLEAENDRYYAENGEFNEAWELWCVRFNRDSRPVNWEEQLNQFRDRGLTQALVMAALHAAAGADQVRQNDKWRYFCGICWKRINQLTEAARAILTVEEADQQP